MNDYQQLTEVNDRDKRDRATDPGTCVLRDVNAALQVSLVPVAVILKHGGPEHTPAVRPRLDEAGR